MSEKIPDKIALAADFVNSTASHIFLTGKAGTGKTTFLHQMAQATHKSYLIVAPTGIAALNAGGVTIHSQFLLPPGTFVPGKGGTDNMDGPFYTSRTLARKNPLNSIRKQVLRNIDLLIIDEVSMLRADLLDAVDYRLKAVKNNFGQSFGGVQLLMIGDLYQLPPVVKEHERRVMDQYYGNPWFFESRALKEDGFVYIELEKIFRQRDDRFIRLLNNLRNNCCTDEDIAELNRHYRLPEEDGDEDVITITTHNYRADEINRKALDALPGKSFYYRADIEGDFPEKLYPLPETLELKEGAQIMFIKNDTREQKYYNGKLGRVKALDGEDICVTLADGDGDIVLEKEQWTNVKYSPDPNTKEPREEVVGSFMQYPVKPAWAVTVHKSQGLTFDRAVIDVGRAFASGQVYVALSRLRSLDGLVLRTRIDKSAISSNADIVDFSGRQKQQPPLKESLVREQRRFLHRLLQSTFDFSAILKQIEYIRRSSGEKMVFEDPEMREALPGLREKFLKEEGNTRQFRYQMERLLGDGSERKLQERIEKGSEYYSEFLKSRLREVLIHLEEVKQLTRTKTYANHLSELDQMITKKAGDVQKASYVAGRILSGEEVVRNEQLEEARKEMRQTVAAEAEEHVRKNPKNLSGKSGRKKKKGETYKKTYALLGEGLTPKEIAAQRELTISTIESHLARGIADGELAIENMLEKGEIDEIKSAMPKEPNGSLREISDSLDGKYSFGKLKMVQAHLMRGEGEG